ncbi:MAG: Hsp20/alpha crystallin family protein [Bacteroidales bacterium]|nr:Hsp20/alpha crystallin family protein [Bacteroidales bacterium]
MAYIRFYSPYNSANRDENSSEAYNQLMRHFNHESNCGCSRQSVPAANISETEQEYLIEMALPGVNKKDIEIKHENGYLHISVNKQDEQHGEEKYTLQEFDYSGATRVFKTGNKVDSEKITAKYENGILQVILTKKEAYVKKPAQSIVVE